MFLSLQRLQLPQRRSLPQYGEGVLGLSPAGPQLLRDTLIRRLVSQGSGSIQTYAVSREEMDQTVPESCSAEASGCVAMLSSWFSTNFLAVILVTAGLMAFQVLGVCLSCCLARSVQVGHLQI